MGKAKVIKQRTRLKALLVSRKNFLKKGYPNKLHNDIVQFEIDLFIKLLYEAYDITDYVIAMQKSAKGKSYKKLKKEMGELKSKRKPKKKKDDR